MKSASWRTGLPSHHRGENNNRNDTTTTTATTYDPYDELRGHEEGAQNDVLRSESDRINQDPEALVSVRLQSKEGSRPIIVVGLVFDRDSADWKTSIGETMLLQLEGSRTPF
jgi:hypothetical protein